IRDAVVRSGSSVSIARDQTPSVAQPVDITGQNLVEALVFSEAVDIEAIIKEVLAGEDRNGSGRLAAIVQLRPPGVDFEPVEILAQFKVQHAGHGVGAVNR